MTTTDARKRNRDMREAHETARARDERAPKWADLFGIDPHYPEPERAEEPHATARARDAAWMIAALDGSGEPRTRTHAINPDTGEFTRLDQESDMTDHRAEAERLLPESRSEEAAQTHALLAIDDTLAEIRDRLPERPTLYTLEGVAAEFGVDLSDDDPAPADVDPDEALAKVINAEVVRMARAGDVKIEADIGIAFERNLARAAREHLMARETYTEEGGRILIAELRKARASEDHAWAECGLNRTDRNRQKARAEKAEADLARVTRERDNWRASSRDSKQAAKRAES